MGTCIDWGPWAATNQVANDTTNVVPVHGHAPVARLRQCRAKVGVPVVEGLAAQLLLHEPGGLATSPRCRP